MYCCVKLQVISLKGSWKKQNLICAWRTIDWHIQNEKQRSTYLRESADDSLKVLPDKNDSLWRKALFLEGSYFYQPGQPASQSWGCHRLTFIRDKLERVAEDSKARDSLLRAIVHKLMSKPIATLATKDLHLSHVFIINILSGMFKQEKVQHHRDPLASDVPCRQWESPSSWWHCLPWWFLWKLAKETSGQTWSDWRTAGGYTGSTRTYLQEAVLEFSVPFSTQIWWWW